MVQKWPVLAIQWSDLDEKLWNRSCDMYLGAVQAPGLGKFCGQRTRWLKVFEKIQNFRKFRKFKENWCTQRKIKHLAWARYLLSWSMSLREFKTYTNLGGPAGSLGSRKAATLPTAGDFFFKKKFMYMVSYMARSAAFTYLMGVVFQFN